jgi:hypothetical protein
VQYEKAQGSHLNERSSSKTNANKLKATHNHFYPFQLKAVLGKFSDRAFAKGQWGRT